MSDEQHVNSLSVCAAAQEGWPTAHDRSAGSVRCDPLHGGDRARDKGGERGFCAYNSRYDGEARRGHGLALGLVDRGMISPGLRADLAIWNVAEPAELSYRIGVNPLHTRIHGGAR